MLMDVVSCWKTATPQYTELSSAFPVKPKKCKKVTAEDGKCKKKNTAAYEGVTYE